MTEVRRLHKLYNIDLKSIDEEKRQITFCFSDDQPDRDGEIIDQASWNVSNYLNNPVILWGHDPNDNANVLGQGISLDLNNNGKSYITARFDDAETNPKADTIFRQLVKRTLRTVSAGFINHTFEWDNDTPLLKDNELLEVSVVAIPSNPRALARSLKDGSISRKDATWMLDSMRKEAAELEKELAKPEQEVHKEVQVDEASKAQLSALTDAVSKIAETLNANSEQMAALVSQVGDMQSAQAGAAKAAEEAQAAEDAAKAEAEAKAAETAADEAKGPKDDNQTTDDAKADDVSDTAKDGENDQSGAVTDTIDGNAELTPELQAQIDSALEAVVQTA
jgi:HK97 family phage prohead protease